MNATGKDGVTPLICAACAPGDKHQIAQNLINTGADVNKTKHNGVSALMRSAYYGYPRNMKVLMEAGANVNMTDCEGVTALMKAVYIGHQQCVKLLIEAGADVNISNKDGVTALMNATYTSNDDHGVLDPGSYNTDEKHLIVDWLIKAGADVNAISNQGGTPMKNAVIAGYNRSLQLLINAGADVNYTTRREILL